MKTRNLLVTKYGEKIRFQLDSVCGEDTKVSFGLHRTCGGFVDVRMVSPSHYVLMCRACRLRIIIPREINTYKKLKKYAKVLREKL